MAAFGQTTKGYFQQGSSEEDQTFLVVVGDNFPLASLLRPASFHSDSWVAAASLSFHLN